ncbi:MAG TPA: hypothetical protein V6D29_17130 [Leptolyngbyaceae cyanobacterium]
MANQNIVFPYRLSLGLLWLVLGWASVPALAQASPEPSRFAAATAAPQTPTVDPAVDLQTYTYGDLFSIQFPQGWQVSPAGESLPVVITNFSPETLDRPGQPEDIRTEVTWVDRPPAEVVAQALQEVRSKGYTMADYGALTIDETTALQLWMTDLPEAPSNAVTTYIGYENGTAIVSSRFGAATPEVQQLLMTLHRSFNLL